ncbi:MAG TPA: carboxypeptidase-like regulatory domain-containing protein, partial [Bacteroidales bacterium]|nr:carboxypeptidase-like regulatory domain-containing protein [Bacteroidales bacterium]
MQTGIKGLFVTTIIFTLLLPLNGQDMILGRKIKLSGTSLKTSKVLGEMNFITGFVFTYDTRIIDPDKKVELPATAIDLHSILDSISSVQAVKYSVIGKHIILYHDYIAPVNDSIASSEIKEIFITGTIVDEESNDPLSYATIGISHRGKGTITNNNGVFILKLPIEFIDDTVSISYVGYLNRCLPVRSLYNNDQIIKMERSFIAIPEIIIRAQDPLVIINKALSRISENYGNTPALLNGFYREGIFRKKEPQIYSEAVL